MIHIDAFLYSAILWHDTYNWWWNVNAHSMITCQQMAAPPELNCWPCFGPSNDRPTGSWRTRGSWRSVDASL